MKIVYKYKLENPEQVTKIMLPLESKILHAAYKDGFYVWVECEVAELPQKLYRLQLMSTGSVTFGQYVNTFFVKEEEVYHLYILEGS